MLPADTEAIDVLDYQEDIPAIITNRYNCKHIIFVIIMLLYRILLLAVNYVIPIYICGVISLQYNKGSGTTNYAMIFPLWVTVCMLTWISLLFQDPFINDKPMCCNDVLCYGNNNCGDKKSNKLWLFLSGFKYENNKSQCPSCNRYII